MKLALAERETIILFNEADADASVYTYNERLKEQAAEHAAHNPVKAGQYFIDDTGALHYTLPKSDLRVLFKKPRTEKQRQAALENIQKALGSRRIHQSPD